MVTLKWRWPVFIVVVVVCASVRAVSALEPTKHFEGPYHIETAPPRRLRATVNCVYHYPNLFAKSGLSFMLCRPYSTVNHRREGMCGS